jgi:putative membrane protein
MTFTRTKSHLLLLIITVVCLVISGLNPYDRMTWVLEIFPIIIAIPIFTLFYKKFPFTNLVYICIFLHALVLMLGGAYSYARVPFGFTIAEWFELSRNPYDKLGHFFQGFAPALVMRELLVRNRVINGTKMLAFVVVCIVLAISATYELIEWAAALILGQGAEEFLGTQGDMWDTQSDMFFALLGALFALIGFTYIHNKQLGKLAIET